jgi:hypothetical protein
MSRKLDPLLIRARLLALAEGNRARIDESAQRLKSDIRRLIDERNSEKRLHRGRELRLLPLAFDLLTDRNGVHNPSPLDPENLPAKFCPIGLRHEGAIPAWMMRGYELLGSFDVEARRLVENLAGHLENARTGRVGSTPVGKGVDLDGVPLEEAYLHAIWLWSNGERDKEDLRREYLDVTSVESGVANVWWAILEFTDRLVSDEEFEQFPETSMWDAVLLGLLIGEPDFSPSDFGLEVPLWDERKAFLWASMPHERDEKYRRVWARLSRVSQFLERRYSQVKAGGDGLDGLIIALMAALGPPEADSVNGIGSAVTVVQPMSLASASNSQGPDLEALQATTPPLDRHSGQWVKAARAAELDGVVTKTLNLYRQAGFGGKSKDAFFGVDKDGRIWRRQGTEKSGVWYFLPALCHKRRLKTG